MKSGSGDRGRQQFTGALDRDQGGPHRDPAHEVVGAVNGVDDPASLTVADLLGVFLTHQAMVRERGSDAFSQPRLDLGIDLGDQGRVAFLGDRQAAGEVAQGDRIGLVQKAHREAAQLGRVAVADGGDGHPASIARCVPPPVLARSPARP